MTGRRYSGTLSSEGEGIRYMSQGKVEEERLARMFGEDDGERGEGKGLKVRKRWEDRKPVWDRHGNLMEYAPKADGSRKNGYVPVKVIVAQGWLGRRLKVDERVVMKDGDVKNLRIENLGVRKLGSREVRWLGGGK